MVDDEAQTTQVHVIPAVEPSDDPEIFEFKVELRMDATVTINNTDWLKPGVTTGIKWKIRNGIMPSRKELEIAMVYMQDGVLTKVLEELIDLIQKGVVQAQMNR